MTPLKVLHQVYSYLPVTQNWIYPQLALNSQCVHTVLSLTEENPGQFPWNSRFCAFSGNRLFDKIGLFLARYWLYQPESFFKMTIAREKPDIVHGHFATESFRVLSRVIEAHLPLVTTFYGLDVDKLSRRHAWKKRYQKLFEAGTLFFAEGPFMARRIEQLGCPGEKIKVIPIGVDPGRFVKVGRPSAQDHVRVMFVGLSREKKGALDAAEIFIAAGLKDTRLHLDVVGDGKYRKLMFDKLGAASLLPRVTFHGQCSVEKYRSLLKQCDLLLVPSFQAADGDSEGGAPVVCIEAQMNSIPVVGTRHCDIPFVVEHGRGGLLSKEHDIGSMANDLLLLAQDVQMRYVMGDYAHQSVTARHDSKQIIATVNEWYQQAVRMYHDKLIKR